MYLRNSEPDAACVLADIARSIRDLRDQVDLYLRHMEEHEILNPFAPGVGAYPLAVNETAPPRFWDSLGIRHIISNTSQGRWRVPGTWDMEIDKIDKVACIWDHVKNAAIIEGLTTLISGCPLIRFADWAATDDASRSWDGVFSDVIKPLKKKDFEFIFQLGDSTKRPVFEVDEILDIMGDYSSYGRVTLMLDEEEALRLCSRLNGADPDAAISDLTLYTLRDRCLFLFNTMSIGVLLIVYGDRTVLITRDWHFEFAGRTLKNRNLSINNKDWFNNGYQLGLLLHFGVAHCIALGLAVSGAYIEHASLPDSETLLAYIGEWGAELRS